MQLWDPYGFIPKKAVLPLYSNEYNYNKYKNKKYHKYKNKKYHKYKSKKYNKYKYIKHK